MNYKEEYRRWLLSESLDEDEREELISIQNDDDTVKFRFSEPMSFGTAGLR